MNGEQEKSVVSREEEKILHFWDANDIFRKTLEKKSPKGDFVFYDGPPFATGTPHHGHLVASAIKDAIPRYKTMRGFRVERQWGWDCHGLPIENIVEKELGTKSKKDIEKLGIGTFNRLCREKIFAYVDAWNEFIPRFGRWADMENPYRTMDVSYMESEWWAFKTLYDKGLLYKDYRSLHICPRCETTLAQAEVAEGYKDIKDLAVTAKFKVRNPEKIGLSGDVFLLAWTTTPWTLPGNVALAVGDSIEYFAAIKGHETVIVSTQMWKRGDLGASGFVARAPKNTDGILKGSDLVGLEYKPLFDDYAKDEALPNRENGWKVYAADFVTTESGTGIVHIAPAFGQDDLELGKKERLPFVQHVGMDGIIRQEVAELAGLSVKSAQDPQATDVAIIKLLAAKGLLFSKEKYEHSYPHCWRCETPLLNYAASSWFVAVQKIKDELLKYSEKINWFPEHIKEGRWGEWLSGARDWSISRQRFWANTIPVWTNEKTGAHKVIGSVAELGEYVKKSGNTYFIMRHGEATHNTADVANSKDMEAHGLTKEGVASVQASAKLLKKKEIDIVFYSPFRRTRETADIVAQEFGLNSSALIPEPRVREVDVGIFDGRKTAEYHAFFSSLEEKFVKTPPQGENLTELKNRVTEFLYDVERRYSGKKILIVSHEYSLWLLCAGAKGLSQKESAAEKGAQKDYIAPAEVREVSFTPLPHNERFELDLHRPYIDELELFDEDGTRLSRVPDVLDTWFDSGSVPFSSYHYPFENEEKIQQRIPADFIGEGQDQVSKWFYYQHVLSGGLFGTHAFKNVVVNGIMLAEDGKKMSKRLKNYPDPALIVDRYGADAVRLYLLSSPVVRAENLKFSEKGVAEISRKVVSRLRNVYEFYALYKNSVSHAPLAESRHVLDRFIVNLFRQTHGIVTDMMDAYRLDAAARAVIDFVDILSTWYIRRSRERFKSEDEADKKDALQTTAWVLREYAKLVAPFAPFAAEWLWRDLKNGNDEESVHLESWTEKQPWDVDVITLMTRVRYIASAALERRSALGIKVRQPLQKLSIQGELPKEYLSLIKDEVNVKEVYADAPLDGPLVVLDDTITPELKKEGQYRELLRFIQDMRKKEGLIPDKKVVLLVKTDAEGERFIHEFESALMKTAGLLEIRFASTDGEELSCDGITFRLAIRHDDPR